MAPVATRIPQLAGRLRTIAAGYEHMCAVRDDGAVICWGRNDFRQAGAPTGETCGSSPIVPCVKTPQVIAGVRDPRELALGITHSCALQGDGKVVCWGNASSGAIGVLDAGATCFHSSAPDAGVPCTQAPQEVSPLAAPSQIAAGGHSMCALVGDRAQCWGYNGEGALGRGGRDPLVTERPAEVLLDTNLPLSGIREVQLTEGVGCALTHDAGVFCWGTSYDGIFVDGGDNAFFATPIR